MATGSPRAAFPAARGGDPFVFDPRTCFHRKADLAVADSILQSLGRGEPREDIGNTVARLLLHHFGTTASAIRPLSVRGTFHFLYRATLTDGRSVVLRGSALGHLWHDDSLLVDAWAMEMLRERELQSLRVYANDSSRALCDFDYEIMDEASGTGLWTLDNSDVEILPALRSLGVFMARIHQIEMSGFGLIDSGTIAAEKRGAGCFSSWKEYIWLNLPEHARTCVEIGAATEAERKSILARFDDAGTILEQVRPVLLHGDCGNHNVFVRDNEITAIIDWEDSLSGDPAFDVAFWATFHPERRHRSFLDGYRSAADCDKEFEWRFWLYFLRIAIAKTVHRFRFQYPDHPDRPPASSRIQLSLRRLAELEAGRSAFEY